MRPALLASLLSLLALAACGDSPAGPSGRGERMPIERVDVQLMESFPVQVAVRVQGYLPDSCWAYAGSTVARSGATFTIEVLMERTAPANAVCLQRIENVEHSLALGALAPGDYTVRVNGITRSFRVD